MKQMSKKQVLEELEHQYEIAKDNAINLLYNVVAVAETDESKWMAEMAQSNACGRLTAYGWAIDLIKRM